MNTTTRIRASLVCEYNNQILLVRMRDPHSQQEWWFPPGGKVEANETPAEAAVREAEEESGYKVRALLETEHIVRYPFTWDGTTYDVTTHFFRGELAEAFCEPRLVTDANYLLEARWCSFEEATRLLAVHEVIAKGVFAALGMNTNSNNR